MGKLRNQLFLSSALLTSALLVVAAWVINHQVVRQARQQVQAEVETLLPLYDAVWNERARRLATTGAAMADSPIVKTVFGDARAARNRQTLHEMIADAGAEAITPGDLVLISDGAGQIIFAEQQGGAAAELTDLTSDIPAYLTAARAASENQTSTRGFIKLGGRLFQLALTPVVLHSGSAEYNNTLAVIGIGSELSRATAEEIKQRIHSEVVFLVDGQAHASSLPKEAQAAAVNAIAASGVLNSANKSSGGPPGGRSSELSLTGDDYLAFSRSLADFDGKPICQAVVLRSLAGAGQLFRAISNRLFVLWSLAIAAAWLLSYLIAGRITRPLESLAESVKQFGQAFGQAQQGGLGERDIAAPAQAQGEVAQLARSFDQMRQSIKQSQTALLKSERLATIGQMASSIIHDLRNPLATISTAAEVMKKDGIQPDRRRTMLETQLRASDRMNAMLTEVLEFSRGSYQLKPSPQPLVFIVQRAAHEVDARMAQLGIQLHINISPEFVLDADDEKLARVFENLLVNAMQAIQQAGPAGGAVEVRATEEKGGVRVDVTDNGPGIPQAIHERLFEPFISYGKPGGTGLGLAIARGIVEAHGGGISLDGAHERGARFIIRLPRRLS